MIELRGKRIMNNWEGIKNEFGLIPDFYGELKAERLQDGQWNVSSASADYRKQFETIARKAGRKLLSDTKLKGKLSRDAVCIKNDIGRWLEAVRLIADDSYREPKLFWESDDGQERRVIPSPGIMEKILYSSISLCEILNQMSNEIEGQKEGTDTGQKIKSMARSFPRIAHLKWSEITMIVSEKAVTVRARDVEKRFSPQDLGFINRRTLTETILFKVLLSMAENGGRFGLGSANLPIKSQQNVPKCISDLRRKLRSIIKAEGDLFKYSESTSIGHSGKGKSGGRIGVIPEDEFSEVHRPYGGFYGTYVATFTIRKPTSLEKIEKFY